MMLSHEQARRAYAQAATPTRDPRALEYDAIVRVTRNLREAGKGGSTFSRLAQAIHENRQIWTLFAASVADTQNALPDELRARLFYLAEFTHTHSRHVLAGSAEVAPLVEINAAVLRGLKAQRNAA